MSGFLVRPESRRRLVDGPLGASSGGDERSEAFVPAQPQQLPIPSQHRDPPPDRAHRPRRHHQPGPLAERQRTRAGEQVEHDGGCHRGRDADRQQVDAEIVAAPLPLVQPERDERRRAPADHTRQQGGAPPAPAAFMARNEARRPQKRLNRRTSQSAINPSLKPIFFPSS